MCVYNHHTESNTEVEGELCIQSQYACNYRLSIYPFNVVMSHTYCECFLFLFIWRVFSTLNVAYVPQSQLASKYMRLFVFPYKDGVYFWLF